MRPPFNLASVDAATRSMVAIGHRLLQTHRFSSDDAEQVRILMGDALPSAGDVVLDAGCGIGEVSRLLAEQCPETRFILLNISVYQLFMAPTGTQFQLLAGDCHAMPLDDQSVDWVIFSSALCQMDIPVALAEAVRVLRPGGRLVINDMSRVKGDPMAMEQLLAARVLPCDELLSHIFDAGLVIDRIEHPAYDDSHFAALLAEVRLGHLAEEVCPLIVRAHKLGVGHGI